MVDGLVTILKWVLSLAFVMALVLATLVLLGIVISYMVIGFSTTILGEIFALIQIWLPFNLNLLLIWLTIAGTAYIAYRLSLMSYSLINSYLGK